MTAEWFEFKPAAPAFETIPYARTGGVMDHNGGTIGPADIVSRVHIEENGSIIMGQHYPVLDSDSRIQLMKTEMNALNGSGVETWIFANSGAGRLGATGNGTEITIDAAGVVNVKVASLDKTVPYVLGRDYTGVNVANTTTETTIASISVPNGTLGTTRSLRFELGGIYLNNAGAGDTITLRVKLGGTTYYADLSVNIPNNAAFRAWHMFGRLQLAGVATSQWFNATMIMGAPTATTGTGDLSDAVFAAPIRFVGAEGMSSGDKTLAFTVQHTTADAAIIFTCNQSIFIVE